MDPYYGICPTCGAYMGRGDGNQCRPCRAERFAGRGSTWNPLNPDNDPDWFKKNCKVTSNPTPAKVPTND